MQRAKSVKVKEVIESLCKLLCALGVDSVPGAETFRRAKFNKADAVPDMWRLLYSVLVKAIQWECSCPALRKPDQDDQHGLVRNLLFQCGYGAPWLLGVEGQMGTVGSRDLLLALGWVLSSGSLLENLLREAAQGLEVFSEVTKVSFLVPAAGGGLVAQQRTEEDLGKTDWEEGLRGLLWLHGKLVFTRRSLQAAQEERAQLLHQVLSLARCPTNPQGCSAKSCVTLARESKELEHLKAKTHVLERFLNWKHLEGLFWCWMGSVIDAKLGDPLQPLPEKAVAAEIGGVASARSCCQVEPGWKTVDQLGEELRVLQAGLRSMRVEPVANTSSWTKRRNDGDDQLSEQAEVHERVQARLRSLKEAYTLSVMGTRYRPCLLEHHGPQPRSPAHPVPCQRERQDGVQASQLVRELREKETVLQSELNRLQQANREELLEWAGRLDGMVLIPPLKR
ncbi:hypothetical protein GN956_G18763 [Arapaima gigas]